jgi:ion channel
VRVAGAVGGAVLIFFVLLDAFETVLLPRRVSRRLRLTGLFFGPVWRIWSGLARRLPSVQRRENVLSFYALFSLMLLLGVWLLGLVIGFALVHWGLGSRLAGGATPAGWWTDLYMSGTTFFTLGLGDLRPDSPGAKLVTVVEAGSGFAFLALVIAYLPVLYQAFSRREVQISMLDEWAGSPPTAVEILRRSALPGGHVAKDRLLADWEQWAAELLESHVSYPMLGYFRSQHDNQSWLAALVSILDVCSLTMTMLEEDPPFQAGLTFAIARHAVVDLRQALNADEEKPQPDRLPEDRLGALRALLTEGGLKVRTDEASVEALTELREMYEPHAEALADQLLMPLPPLVPDRQPRPDWQVTAWDLPDWENADKRTGNRRRSGRLFRRDRHATPPPEVSSESGDAGDEAPEGDQEGRDKRRARRR